MRFRTAVLLLCTIMTPSLVLAEQAPALQAAEQPAAEQVAAEKPVAALPSVVGQQAAAANRAYNIDLALERAMAQNLIAGGVVVVGNHEGILATAARGRVNGAGSASLNERTIFDLASLTKVVATAPAVVKLLDEGKISLNDPVSRYIPEFANYAGGQLTIQHLLTHTSGLDDMTVASTMEGTVRKAAAERNRRPGMHFHYADINFILLGELVHRVSGQTLDVFCREQIYSPLGARETMFLPPRSLASNIAPTTGYTAGVVQDPNARRLGGVAGHAGLFSSAYDLSLYARMLLGGGTVDNKRIFSEQIIGQMCTPYACGSARRGLGWDIDSPYSAPRGSYFSASSYGHTGYSGSSIWIDPQQDLFVILLTRRLNYREPGRFNQLRRDVSTLASASFRGGDGRVPQVQYAAATKSDAQALQAAAPAIAAAPAAIEVYEKDGVLVATNVPQHKQQVQRRVAKVQRVAAKVGTRHASRTIRVAKAESTKWSHKKRRTLAKS